MNPLNYASLEASKRLVDAGIVLETEQYHTIETYEDSPVWCEVPTEGTDARPRPIKIKVITTIPAPSMAEVWRELPGEISYEYALDVTKIGQDTQAIYSKIDIFDCYVTKGSGRNINPTDALIDLLIWQRKEANHA